VERHGSANSPSAVQWAGGARQGPGVSGRHHRGSRRRTLAAKSFVGNLDFHTTRDQLESLFSEVGEIRDVFLPMDRATARPRGFAFVEFATEEAAEQAIEKFNDYELGGRTLRVNLAEERAPRPGGFSGGGGGRPPFGGGGPGGPRPGGPRGGIGKPKGSRRNLRAKKRSL